MAKSLLVQKEEQELIQSLKGDPRFFQYLRTLKDSNSNGEEIPSQMLLNLAQRLLGKSSQSRLSEITKSSDQINPSHLNSVNISEATSEVSSSAMTASELSHGSVISGTSTEQSEETTQSEWTNSQNSDQKLLNIPLTESEESEIGVTNPLKQHLKVREPTVQSKNFRLPFIFGTVNSKRSTIQTASDLQNNNNPPSPPEKTASPLVPYKLTRDLFDPRPLITPRLAIQNAEIIRHQQEHDYFIKNAGTKARKLDDEINKHFTLGSNDSNLSRTSKSRKQRVNWSNQTVPYKLYPDKYDPRPLMTVKLAIQNAERLRVELENMLELEPTVVDTILPEKLEQSDGETPHRFRFTFQSVCQNLKKLKIRKNNRVAPIIIEEESVENVEE